MKSLDIIKKLTGTCYRPECYTTVEIEKYSDFRVFCAETDTFQVWGYSRKRGVSMPKNYLYAYEQDVEDYYMQDFGEPDVRVKVHCYDGDCFIILLWAICD